MSYPQQTFSTIQQLLNYINTNIVTNGNEEIDAVEVNNIENALANFIVSYTINANRAGISSSSGVVSLSKPITIFTVVPASLQWPDNIQFEYYIVNTTSSIINITSGYSYVDSSGNLQTVIPAHATVHIAKATNGSWVQVNNLSTNTSSNINIIQLQFIVGQPGSLMDAGDTVLILTYSQLFSSGLEIFKDNVLLPVNLSDRQSYTAIFSSTDVTITFNQAAADGDLYIIKLFQFV